MLNGLRLHGLRALRQSGSTSHARLPLRAVSLILVVARPNAPSLERCRCRLDAVAVNDDVMIGLLGLLQIYIDTPRRRRQDPGVEAMHRGIDRFASSVRC